MRRMNATRFHPLAGERMFPSLIQYGASDMTTINMVKSSSNRDDDPYRLADFDDLVAWTSLDGGARLPERDRRRPGCFR